MDFSNGKNNSGNLYILAAAVLWGTTGTAQAFAPAGASSMTVGTVRLAVGGAALLLLALVRRQFSPENHWPLVTTLISAFFVASYQLCFFAAVAKTGVAVGTMVAIGSSPIAAGVLGFYCRGERLDRPWCIATACAVFGCVMLSAAGGEVNIDVYGILLALGAGFSYAMYTVSIKRLLDDKSPDAVMAVVFCLAAVLLLPSLFIYDSAWLLQPRGILVALHLGIVTAMMSYWLYARGLKIVRVGNVATLSLAEPLTATLLGVFVLSEQLSGRDIIGVAAIFAGILILSRSSSTAEPMEK